MQYLIWPIRTHLFIGNELIFRDSYKLFRVEEKNAPDPLEVPVLLLLGCFYNINHVTIISWNCVLVDATSRNLVVKANSLQDDQTYTVKYTCGDAMVVYDFHTSPLPSGGSCKSSPTEGKIRS